MIAMPAMASLAASSIGSAWSTWSAWSTLSTWPTSFMWSPSSAWAVEAWARWMTAVSWQLVPLALVVLLLDRLFLRRAGPVVQSAVWWIVLLKLLLPPGLASPISLAHVLPAPEVLTSTAPAAARAIVRAVTGERRGPRPSPGEASASTGTPAAPPPTHAGIAFVIWLAGLLTAAGVARRRYQRLRLECLTGSGAASREVRTIAVAAGRRLGLRVLPPIRVGAAIERPAVLGFLAPIVILPQALVGRRVALEHVLLHELAHVRRRDPLASLIGLIAQIVFWFHPAIWCARRRLATLRELACDRTVARILGRATSGYRRTLILLAQPAVAAAGAHTRAMACSAGAPGALGLFQRRAQIVARLDALARPIGMRRATERLASAMIALALLVSCAPLASPHPPPPPAFQAPDHLSSATPRPETPRPETLPPETLLPETLLPETLLPETLLPETLLPETLPPETPSPARLSPEMRAPQRRAPETLLLAEPSPIEPSFDVPSLDRLPGSLQKRYAVMRAMAFEAEARHPRE